MLRSHLFLTCPYDDCLLIYNNEIIFFFQFDFNWPEYQKAVENLNSCLAADNLQNFHKILQQKDLDEEQLTVAIGVHIIKKLCEKAVTGKKKAKMKCVCGCGEGLEEGNMWIGKTAVKIQKGLPKKLL